MREYGGEYEDGIATCRETFPIVKSGEGEDQDSSDKELEASQKSSDKQLMRLNIVRPGF